MDITYEIERKRAELKELNRQLYEKKKEVPEEIREIAKKARKVVDTLGHDVWSSWDSDEYSDPNICIRYIIRLGDLPAKIHIYERGGRKYKIPIVRSISRGKLVYMAYIDNNDVEVVKFEGGGWISYLYHLYSRILDGKIEGIRKKIEKLEEFKSRIEQERK